MSTYLYVYHGGKKPESEEAMKEEMQAWGNWLGGMGDAVVDGGNPVGLSHTVSSDKSVAENGGSNPVSGYSIISADSYSEATEKAKACPILNSGGSVEVAEIMNVM